MGDNLIPSVNARMADRIAELARELTGAEPTQASRIELRFRARGSLAVCIAGPHRGDWFDHEAGCGGDPLGLVAHLHGVSMREALAWALAWLGDAPAREHPRPMAAPVALPDAPQGDGKAWSRDMARRLWAERHPASEAAAYLTARGLDVPDDAPLAFHPSAWRNAKNGPHGPAMLALMTDPATAEPVGVHVTYLRSDRAGKAEGASAKVMLGRVGVIRLVPDAEVTYGLGLAEGIETALAVMQRTGWAPVWAATSAGAIARFPVLPGIEALTVFADADGPGIEAARECCQRWADAGREARILAPPAGDWDDTLPRRGVAA